MSITYEAPICEICRKQDQEGLFHAVDGKFYHQSCAEEKRIREEQRNEDNLLGRNWGKDENVDLNVESGNPQQ
jgi:hypothetical protein